jgi:predicted PurR-regulated permease PerM
LEPVVAWLSRRHVPRLAGTCLLLLTVLGITGWGAYSLRDEVTAAIDSLPQAAKRAREMVTSRLGDGPAASIQRAAAALRGETTSSSGEQSPQPGPTDETATVSSDAQAGGTISGVSGFIQRGIGSLFALVGHIVVIFFLVFFLLLSGSQVRARVIEIAGPDDDRRQTAAMIIDDINVQIQRFLLVRLLTAVIVGVLTWIVLAWLDVQNAAVWGILAGVFNSIPYFGPIIVSGGLLVVGLVQGGGITQALQMSAAALVITSLEGWLLTPPLMGKAERMSALAVFLGLLLWTWIWGAWGTILAVPMLVIVKSVADHVPRLRPIGRLMAP